MCISTCQSLCGVGTSGAAKLHSMPVYRLSNELVFPPPNLADPGGLLAVGGDLRPERLLLAYKNGIFPWYSKEDPILWWAPDPRLILYLDDLKISRSLAKTIRKSKFRISFDTAFAAVITACANHRGRGREESWITDEMNTAYQRLHELGYAHSVECWHHQELVGGLYGVSLGRAFFGESMFSSMADASKVALVYLRDFLARKHFHFIDCQLPTQHLIGLGAIEVPRDDFQSCLNKALEYPSLVGPWQAI